MRVSIIAVWMTVLIFFSAIVGCSDGILDQRVELQMCSKAASILDLNHALMSKGVQMKLARLEGPQTREEQMRETQAVSGAAHRFIGEDDSIDVSKLMKVYKSDICQEALNSYVDEKYGPPTDRDREISAKYGNFDYAKLREVGFFSRSMSQDGKSEILCADFNSQMRATYSESSRKFKDDLEGGVRASILDSLHRLAKFRREYVEARLVQKDFFDFANEVRNACNPESASLSESLGKVESILSHRSARTVRLSEMKLLYSKEQGCGGDFEKIFCLNRLYWRAVQFAEMFSHTCDVQESQELACAATADEIFKISVAKLELHKLKLAERDYRDHIKDPRHSRLIGKELSVGRFDFLINPCKKEAIEMNMKGSSYSKYVKEVCEPRVMSKYVEAEFEELERIRSKIKYLRDFVASFPFDFELDKSSYFDPSSFNFKQ